MGENIAHSDYAIKICDLRRCFSVSLPQAIERLTENKELTFDSRLMEHTRLEILLIHSIDKR